MDLQTLFRWLDDAGLWTPEQVLERQSIVKTAGTTDTRLYYIQEGTLRIFVAEEEEEKTIRFGYAGNIITALDSFITEAPSDLYIQAIKRTRIRSMAKFDYLSFMQATKERQLLWDQLLQQLLLQQMERERDLLIRSPQERYQRVLQRSPQLFQEVPHKYIANYLRMTPETLSRLKKS